MEFRPSLHPSHPKMQTNERYILFISCKNLPKQYSQVSLYIKIENSTKCLIGTTEQVNDTSNPEFFHTFELNFHPSIKQKLIFKIIDNANPVKDKVIGKARTTLEYLISSKDKSKEISVVQAKKKRSDAALIVRCEKTSRTQCSLVMGFKAKTNHNKRLWHTLNIASSSECLFRLSRSLNDQQRVLLYESDLVRDKFNPVWDNFEIEFHKLCNNRYDIPIDVSLYSISQSSSYELFGRSQFTLDKILNLNEREFQLLDPCGEKIGILSLKKFEFVNRPSFDEYMAGGMEISLNVGINFSYSEDNEESHSNQGVNEYSEAIYSVCEKLIDHNNSKEVPMYGFGGIPENGETVENYFELNGYLNTRGCRALDDIKEVYRKSLSNVELQGSTVLEPIFTKAIREAIQLRQEKKPLFNVYVLFTQSVVQDIQRITEIILKEERVNLPLLIFIVGVGSDCFTKLEMLNRRTRDGHACKNKLIHFVRFGNYKIYQGILRDEMLDVLSKKVEDYFLELDIQPRPVDNESLSHSFAPSFSEIPEGLQAQMFGLSDI